MAFLFGDVVDSSRICNSLYAVEIEADILYSEQPQRNSTSRSAPKPTSKRIVLPFQPFKSSAKKKKKNMLYYYLTCFLTFLWLLAVFKVFVLDDGKQPPNITSVQVKSGQQLVQGKTAGMAQSAISSRLQGNPPGTLQWPPVNLDGSIPAADGSDKMPIIDIEVPRFWFPPEGTDYNTVGSKVGGEETIFLMIASYRDFQCRETITSAFDRSDHPERLFVGAVDQLTPGDIGCLDIEIPCSQDPNQAICKYRDQIAVYKMDAQYATGPVTARHIGDRMYRGEYFVMQMDAHCQFVRHWDTLLIEQWRSTGNEMAVLR